MTDRSGMPGFFRHSLAITAALMLSSCAAGPDFMRPAAPAGRFWTNDMPAETAGDPDHGIDAQHFDAEAVPMKAWWHQFGSTPLNVLVEQALASNASITAATAALKSAQEYVSAQRGYFYPSVGVGYSLERQQLSGNTGGNSPGIQNNGSVIATTQGTPASQGGTAPYNAPVIYSFHTATVNVGFTPDIFGANRRAVESLVAQADVQRFQLAAVQASLAANVVGAALQEALLRAQIEAQQEIIRINQKSLMVLSGQQQLGYASGMDLAAQEAALAQARQQLPALQKQLAQVHDLLRALVSADPGQDVDAMFTLDELHLPTKLPAILPADMVNNRPDVRMAEAWWHAASAQVGVAQAARFPQFGISAAYGGNASAFNRMFEPGGPFWNVIGSVAQPLFSGGTLLHRKRAAEQTMLQAQAQYQVTLIAAFQNVSDSLQAVRYDAEALVYATQSEQAARRSLTIAEKQLGLGYVSGLALLQAQQAYQQALLSLVQARALRLGDTAALYLALGGGTLED